MQEWQCALYVNGGGEDVLNECSTSTPSAVRRIKNTARARPCVLSPHRVPFTCSQLLRLARQAWQPLHRRVLLPSRVGQQVRKVVFAGRATR